MPKYPKKPQKNNIKTNSNKDAKRTEYVIDTLIRDFSEGLNDKKSLSPDEREKLEKLLNLFNRYLDKISEIYYDFLRFDYGDPVELMQSHASGLYINDAKAFHEVLSLRFSPYAGSSTLSKVGLFSAQYEKEFSEDIKKSEMLQDMARLYFILVEKEDEMRAFIDKLENRLSPEKPKPSSYFSYCNIS